MKNPLNAPVIALVISLVALRTDAAILDWRFPEEQKTRTFAYGEMEVLASAPLIYFSGLNSSCHGAEVAQVGHPHGLQVGGGHFYCGIQEHRGKERNVIFTAWDTALSLPALCVQADPATVRSHSGSKDYEGGSFHTDRLCYWKECDVFRFALSKLPAKNGGTVTTFYFFDPATRDWRLEASIVNPDDGHGTASYIGSSTAFLENFGRANYDKPKLCVYRLWIGSGPNDLAFVRRAEADDQDFAGDHDFSPTERCGILNGSFFLAQGSRPTVDYLLAKYSTSKDGFIVAMKAHPELGPIADHPLSGSTVAELRSLPRPKDAR